MPDDRRRDDLETERRIATLEANRTADEQRAQDRHEDNQTAIAKLVDQAKLTDAKLDLMLQAVHMAKGGWWAAGKLIGLILGLLSGLAGVASGVWWLITHLTIRPTVAALVALALFRGAA